MSGNPSDHRRGFHSEPKGIVMKQYKVIHIIEPDFGCEGLPDGSVRMDQVILQDEEGVRIIVEVADAYLYEQRIDEGDVVIRTEQELRRL